MGDVTNAMTPSKSEHQLVAAREHALAIIKLATGRPSPGALLLAFDYRATLLKLHADVLGPIGAEDTRLIEVAVALIRAGHDAEHKGHLDPNLRNYYARLQDAARTSTWACSYVARIHGRSAAALTIHRANPDLSRQNSASIAEHMMNATVQDVFTTSTNETFSMPAQAPSAPHDRRSPTSIYQRRGGPPQPIATKVRVTI